MASSIGKSQFALACNLEKMVKQHGENRVGFLTLTFPDNVTDHKEASARFNQLASHYIRSRFGPYICVKERQKRGAWHFHLVIVCPFDIKRGGKFHRAGARFRFKTGNVPLINLWREMRERLPAYGFGRAELLPIRKTGEAMSRYVSKYISKHFRNCADAPPKVKLVTYSQGLCRAVQGEFSWHTPRMTRLRHQVRHLAMCFGLHSPDECRAEFGRHWAHRFFSHAAYRLDMYDAHAFNQEMDHINRVCEQRFLDVSEYGQLVNRHSGEVYF